MFNLFHSRRPSYNKRKSLVENFNSICSLRFPYKRSDATRNLANILAVCNLHWDGKELSGQKDRIKLREDWAVLELANLALIDWLNKRRNESRRVEYVEILQSQVKSLQAKFLAWEKVLAGANKSWKHPKLDILKYLRTDKQKEFYQQLTSKNALIINEQANERTPLLNKHSVAIFVPLLNYLFDFNLFDYLDFLDFCNIGLMW